MKRFENKVVVITGAAGGIGEATTRRIVSEGGKVVIADLSQERADKLAAELTQAGLMFVLIIVLKLERKFVSR